MAWTRPRSSSSDAPWQVWHALFTFSIGLRTQWSLTFMAPAQWGLATGGIPTSLRLVVAGDRPRELYDPIREVVRRLDPSLAVAEASTLTEIRDVAVAQPRLRAVLTAAFASVALVLALVGVYGVIAYTVGRRRKEIGVRMALGAFQNEVVALMLRRGARMVGAGLGMGILLTLGMGRFVESLLYGVEPADPATLILVLLGFAVVALLATWLPARRAARVDPERVLRSE